VVSLSQAYRPRRDLHSFPTRRSSDLLEDDLHPAMSRDIHRWRSRSALTLWCSAVAWSLRRSASAGTAATRARSSASSGAGSAARSEEHTSELQSRGHLVCRLLLEKKN